jgi:lipoprotein signal peptidase
MSNAPLHLILWAALVGAFACTYHAVLIAPSHILSKWWRQPIERFVQWVATRTNYGKAWSVLAFLTKSLTDCEYCLAGQVAVIVYLVRGGRSIIDLALFTTAAILIGAFLFQHLTHVERKNRPSGN